MKIGGEFDLNLDQIGELDAQIRGVLRGKEKASTFSSDIQSLLEIDADKARTLTTRINKDVFDTVKAALESHEQETSMQAIEQAGGFEIERPNSPTSGPVEEKRDIMAGIENPEPATVRKEPLVEQLLRGTTAVPEQKIVRAAPAMPPTKAPSSSDPYRETIE